jgi:hypothetical protein
MSRLRPLNRSATSRLLEQVKFQKRANSPMGALEP